jgi:hypothetical protein
MINLLDKRGDTMSGPLILRVPLDDPSKAAEYSLVTGGQVYLGSGVNGPPIAPVPETPLLTVEGDAVFWSGTRQSNSFIVVKRAYVDSLPESDGRTEAQPSAGAQPSADEQPAIGASRPARFALVGRGDEKLIPTIEYWSKPFDDPLEKPIVLISLPNISNPTLLFSSPATQHSADQQKYTFNVEIDGNLIVKGDYPGKNVTMPRPALLGSSTDGAGDAGGEQGPASSAEAPEPAVAELAAEDAAALLAGLRPVTVTPSDEAPERHLALQVVPPADDKARDASAAPSPSADADVIAALTAVVQEQHAAIAALTSAIDGLSQRVQQLEAR